MELLSEAQIKLMCKRYQYLFSRSMSLRTQFESTREGSKLHERLMHDLQEVEKDCQDLDERIFWAVRLFSVESEYVNHLKSKPKNQ